MSKVDLRFEVPGQARLGEDFVGRVRVSAREAVRVQGIDVRVACVVGGSTPVGDKTCDVQGFVAWEDKGEAIELQAGQEMERNFRARLTDGPISYQGKYFRVDWSVHACARLPWQRDVEQKLTLRVLPAKAGAFAAVGQRTTQVEARPASRAAAPRKRLSSVVWTGGLLIVGGLAAPVYFYTRVTPGHEPTESELLPLLGGFLAVVAGVGVLLLGGILYFVRQLFSK